MVSSYREASENYKNEKKKPLIEEDTWISSKAIKKKKKHKKSKHKHEYVPAIYHLSYKRSDGKIESHDTCGEHCKICGRVNDMRFLWFNPDENIKKFKKEYPNYVEIQLPEGWDVFKDKNIPV